MRSKGGLTTETEIMAEQAVEGFVPRPNSAIQTG